MRLPLGPFQAHSLSFKVRSTKKVSGDSPGPKTMAGLEHFAAQRSPLADGVVIGVILIVLISYVSGFLTLSAKPNVLGGDFTTLQHQAQNWLAGGPMYPAFELGWPFQVALPGLILYPPV